MAAVIQLAILHIFWSELIALVVEEFAAVVEFLGNAETENFLQCPAVLNQVFFICNQGMTGYQAQGAFVDGKGQLVDKGGIALAATKRDFQ